MVEGVRIVGAAVDGEGLSRRRVFDPVGKHLAFVVRVLHILADAARHGKRCLPARYSSNAAGVATGLLVDSHVGVVNELAHYSFLLAEVAWPAEHIATVSHTALVCWSLDGAQA